MSAQALACSELKKLVTLWIYDEGATFTHQF